MIRNREELINLTAQWMNHAQNDVRAQLNAFINAMNTSREEVANALAISVDELNGIMDGTVGLSLEVFAKLLIATDNMLEIKPLSMTPYGNPSMNGMRGVPHQMPSQPMGGHRMPPPPMGGHRMPPPPMGGNGYPQPMGGMPMNGGQPRRFSHVPGMESRFGNTQGAIQVGGEQPLNELASLDRASMVEIIRNNGWDTEIDLATANRGEIIGFINAKRATQGTAQQMAQQAPPCAQHVPMNAIATDMGIEVPEEGTAQPTMSAQELAFQEMIAHELEENPNLRSVLEQYRQ